MPQISKKNEDKIKEMILSFLFQNSPKMMFTSEIASNLVRDEEFTKRLMVELEKSNLAVSVKKNHEGYDYVRRIRWRLSEKAFQAYKLLNQPLHYDDEEHTYI